MLYNTHPRLVGYSDCELDDIVDTHMHGMPPSPRGARSLPATAKLSLQTKADGSHGAMPVHGL